MASKPLFTPPVLFAKTVLSQLNELPAPPTPLHIYNAGRNNFYFAIGEPHVHSGDATIKARVPDRRRPRIRNSIAHHDDHGFHQRRL